MKRILFIALSLICINAFADQIDAKKTIIGLSEKLKETSQNYETEAKELEVDFSLKTQNQKDQLKKLKKAADGLKQEKDVYKAYAIKEEELSEIKAKKYKKYALKQNKKATDRLLSSVYADNKQANLIIFASLDMPTESLAQITLDAYRYEVPVIIRGLYKNSYKETVNRITEVLTANSFDNPLGGFAIDPNWFVIYNIKEVPTYVLSDELATCQSNDFSNCDVHNFDVLQGNITVTSALNEFKRRGDFSDLAKTILKRGQ